MWSEVFDGRHRVGPSWRSREKPARWRNTRGWGAYFGNVFSVGSRRLSYLAFRLRDWARRAPDEFVYYRAPLCSHADHVLAGSNCIHVANWNRQTRADKPIIRVRPSAGLATI